MIIGGWILKNISHLIERGWNEEICGIVRRLDMLVKIGCLISVIILAVITQHVIGWAGSILHQIGDTGQNYALFVFMDDRHQPMTNNILMNIFIPNIVSVFLYIVLQKLSVSNITIWVGLYVLFYFVYRFILICVILRRKELYTIRYEWGMAVSSLIICLLLICFFFGKNNNLLISVNDLKEELWFAILLIIYTFIKNILDSKVKQDDVLTRRQLEKYINNNFEILYRRYHRELNITREDRQVWLIIFSIMIFENFNRGAMLRWLERLKLKVVGHATVGIMQVSSDKVLTDMESILEAYERIIKFGEELNIDFSDELLSLFLNDLLMKYNPDENYASSVTYIYQCLYSFVYDNEPYCRDFGLGKNDTPICEVDKMEKKIIRCGSIREVVWKLKDYTEIHMRSAVYNILDGMEENEHIRVDREYDGWRVRFCNLHNFVIDGENSEWFSPFTQCTVLFLKIVVILRYAI